MQKQNFFDRMLGRSQVLSAENIVQHLELVASGKTSYEDKVKILNAFEKTIKKAPAHFLAAMVKWQNSTFEKEITDYKNAILEAEDPYRPRRHSLQEIYKDLHRDTFINGIVERNLILKLSNRPFKICNSEEEKDQDKTNMLRKRWFHWYIKEAMRSRFFGHSLVYFMDLTSGDIKDPRLVWRTHVQPEIDTVFYSPASDEGFNYLEAPYSNFMVAIGDKFDLGIYLNAIPIWIIKKHSWSAWDRFEELFGVPLRIAKTTSRDKKVLDEIELFLQNMGQANYAMFDMDTELDIQANPQRDSYQVFNEKRKAANEELEILLTGQRRITLENGSLAKEQVLQEQTDEIVKDDKTFLYYHINDVLLPFLRQHGYAIPEDFHFQWDDAKELEPLDRLKVYESASRIGITPDSEAFAAEFGITLSQTQEPNQPEAVKNFIRVHEQISNLYLAE